MRNPAGSQLPAHSCSKTALRSFMLGSRMAAQSSGDLLCGTQIRRDSETSLSSSMTIKKTRVREGFVRVSRHQWLRRRRDCDGNDLPRFRKRSRQSNEGSRFQRSFLKPLQALLVLRTSHRDHRANRGGAMSDRRGRRKATGTLCRLGGAQSHRWLLRIGTVENLDILCDHNSLGGTRRLIPLTQVALYVKSGAIGLARHGGPRRLTVDSSRFLAARAIWPWHMPWPAPQTCRHVSQ